MLSDAYCGGSGTSMMPIYFVSSSSYSDKCLSQITEGKMTFYAVEFNGTTVTGYKIYNSQITPSSFSISMGSNVMAAGGHVYIGGGPGEPPWNGFISNVQIYNATLTSNEIFAQYVAGFGGAPVNLKNLIAWYPLNGNANDYSGNNNNGVPSNVIYTAAWESAYSGT